MAKTRFNPIRSGLLQSGDFGLQFDLLRNEEFSSSLNSARSIEPSVKPSLRRPILALTAVKSILSLSAWACLAVESSVSWARCWSSFGIFRIRGDHRDLRIGGVFGQPPAEGTRDPHGSRRASRGGLAGRVRMRLQASAFGSAAGLILGFLASRVLASIVYQATPRDQWVIAGVVVVTLSTGMLATAIPAKRALAADPLMLLRDE